MAVNKEYVPPVEDIIKKGISRVPLTTLRNNVGHVILGNYLVGNLDSLLKPASQPLSKRTTFANGEARAYSANTLTDLGQLEESLRKLDYLEYYKKPIGDVYDLAERLDRVRLTSLNREVGNEGIELGDLFPDKTNPSVEYQALDGANGSALLDEMRKLLTPEELAIVGMRHVHGLKFEEIGVEIGESRQTATNRYNKSIKKLKPLIGKFQVS